MKKLLLLVGLLLISTAGFSQIGIGNTNPDSSSLLDITATDKGVLVPRVSLTDVTNIVTPINNPTESLLVYNTNNSVTGGNGIGFYYFNGTSWKKITSTDDIPSVNLKDIGVVSAFPGATYPNDMFLPISGGTFNDADYPEFANFISNLDSDVVTNNGNGTFTLANWNNNGIFLRSTGGNASSIGDLQQDATALPNTSFSTASESVATDSDGNHTHSISTKQDDWNVSGGPISGGPSFGIDNGTLAPRLDTDSAGNHTHNVTIPVLNINGGDAETRPINRSITWVIKVKPSASSVSNLTINNITDIGTDNQNITGSGLVGTNLTIGIENGSSQVINLASLQDGTGTDDQNITGSGLSGTNLTIGIENGASQVIDLSSLQGSNTLDQAYDEGGPGAGSTINANDGAVTIGGLDGLLVTGIFNIGDTAISGAGIRMFFNPNKVAFRAGGISGNQWDNANIGIYSNALGRNTKASGGYSTALGYSATASGVRSVSIGYNTVANGTNSIAIGASTTASGDNATAMGTSTRASSYSQFTIGRFNTLIGSNSSSWDLNDPLFVIGNGFTNTNRGNALTILKSGLMNINDEYNMPLTDGAPNYIMQTNGTGQVSFVDPATIGDGTGTDDQNLTGATLTGTSLQIDIENGNSATVNLASLQDGTGTDDQNIVGSGLSGTNLTIGIENGSSQVINLSSLQDGTGTDDQNITGSGLSGTNLTIGIENGSSQVINLASLQDGTGTDDQNIAGSGLSGTNLTIGIENGSSQVINLASLQDGTGTDDQNIAGSGLSGTNLTIGIENGSSQVINLASLQDGTGTDDQAIDTFSFDSASNILTLEVENDGVAAQTVNLSSLQDGTGTDDQNLTGATLTGTSLQIDIENGNSTTVDLGTLQDGNTQNTLDQAYDEGGAGSGRSITADSGTVEINGSGGLSINRDTNAAGSAINVNQLATSTGDKEAINTTLETGATTPFVTKLSYMKASTLNHYGIHAFTDGSRVGTEVAHFEINSTPTYTSSISGVTSTVSYNNIINYDSYGFKSEVSGSGESSKYGYYTYIPVSSGGDHFGVYANIQKNNSYAGYFIGRLSLGNTTTNRYLMPAADGAANFIMQTNGLGQVSFVDPLTIADGTGSDDQNITGSGLSGTNLTIGIENGTSQVINLASLQDGTGTDNQNISGSGVAGTNLTIGIENGASEVINLSSLQDGVGATKIDELTDGKSDATGSTVF